MCSGTSLSVKSYEDKIRKLIEDYGPICYIECARKHSQAEDALIGTLAGIARYESWKKVTGQ